MKLIINNIKEKTNEQSNESNESKEEEVDMGELKFQLHQLNETARKNIKKLKQKFIEYNEFLVNLKYSTFADISYENTINSLYVGSPENNKIKSIIENIWHNSTHNVELYHTVLALLWWNSYNKKGIKDYYEGVNEILSIKQLNIHIPDTFESDKFDKNELNTNVDFYKALTNIYIKKHNLSSLEEQEYIILPNGDSFADCGETTLRNFIKILIHDINSTESTELNLNILDSFGAIEPVREYFRKFNTLESHSSFNARTEWNDIVSNLDGIEYNITSDGKKYELIGGENGMLKVIKLLFTGVTNFEDFNRIDHINITKRDYNSIKIVSNTGTYIWIFYNKHYDLILVSNEIINVDFDISNLTDNEKYYLDMFTLNSVDYIEKYNNEENNNGKFNNKYNLFYVLKSIEDIVSLFNSNIIDKINDDYYTSIYLYIVKSFKSKYNETHNITINFNKVSSDLEDLTIIGNGSLSGLSRFGRVKIIKFLLDQELNGNLKNLTKLKELIFGNTFNNNGIILREDDLSGLNKLSELTFGNSFNQQLNGALKKLREDDFSGLNKLSELKFGNSFNQQLNGALYP